jgi:hypothetical protein
MYLQRKKFLALKRNAILIQVRVFLHRHGINLVTRHGGVQNVLKNGSSVLRVQQSLCNDSPDHTCNAANIYASKNRL